MTQIAQYLYPDGSIHHIDLNYEPTVSEGGGGSRVRVWLNTPQSFGPNTQAMPPAFHDFRGQQAQAIRRNAAKMAVGANLTVLLEVDEARETTEQPRTAAAGKSK